MNLGNKINLWPWIESVPCPTSGTGTGMCFWTVDSDLTASEYKLVWITDS